MTVYLNNALASSMIPDGVGLYPARSYSPAAIREILVDSCGFVHAGNPSHAPTTWRAVATRLRLPEVANPKGGKVVLQHRDVLVVAEVTGLPRETREFTAEEISSAEIKYRVFLAYSE